MSDKNSTAPTPSGKPGKPFADFPLFAHASGQWAKKVRGKLVYFGVWSDPDAALKSYLKQKDALHAGRKPRPDADAVTVKDVANAFLNHKKSLLEAGELSTHTWLKYQTAARLAVAQLGKQRLVSDLAPEDFAALRKKMAAKWGVERLSVMIQSIRSMFKHGYDAELLPEPIRFGPGFSRRAKKVFRLHRAQQGAKLFTADEIRRMIDTAGLPLSAMLLLGVNCGFGNSDCANLPLSAVDLDNALIDYPRPKTGIARRCPLWPETVTALKEVIAKRREAKDAGHAGLVFVTRWGNSWGSDNSHGPLVTEVRKLLKRLGIRRRKGLGFYTLRHVFRTVADESKDQPAVDYIMGHEVAHMSSHYRETISDDRLRAAADHVRCWLFKKKEATAKGTADWSLPLQPIAATEAPEMPPLSGGEQQANWQYGLGKANYKQVVLAKRLMMKGWRDPYYYRGYVWLSNPQPKESQTSLGGDVLGKAIRITKTGRILRGW
jgi:integrase